MSNSKAADEVIPKDKKVHFGAEEAVEGFFGTADYGLVFVERGVQDEGDVRNSAKMLDEAMVAGICALANCL